MITCSVCKQPKPDDCFYKEKSRKGIFYIRQKARCKDCLKKRITQWQKDNKNRVNKHQRKNTKKLRRNPDWVINRKCNIYGVDKKVFYAMYYSQSGKCAICYRKMSVLNSHWDHSHKIKPFKLRGLLCRLCNVGLGHFKDKIIYLKSAIGYIKNRRMV